MMDAEDRLAEWRQSATRVGADEALAWVLSWYETIDLANIKGVREGSRWVEDPEWVKRRQETAYSFIQYADINNFRADPNAPAEDEPEAEGEFEAEGEDDGEADDEAEDEEVDEEIEAESDPRTVPASKAPSSSGAAGP